MQAYTRASKKTRAARGGYGSLDAYFDQLGRHALLSPAREFELAQGIEEVELAQWTVVFEPSAGRRSVRAAVERAHGAPLESVAAVHMRGIDPDRDLLLVALAEVNRIADEARLSLELADWRARVRAFAADAARARQQFAEANLRLVVKVAREYDYGRLPLPDLIQEGNVGLLQAIGRFDAERGTRFATYAVWWIRHAVRRALVNKARSVRLPNHIAGAGYRVLNTAAKMTQKLGRPPDRRELAEACDMSPDKLERVQIAMRQTDVSLETPQSESDDNRTLADVLPAIDEADMTVHDMLAFRRQLEQVLQLLPGLSQIEADIVRRRFGLLGSERETLVAIGDRYGLSRERIRQLQRQALENLRRGLRRRGFM